MSKRLKILKKESKLNEGLFETMVKRLKSEGIHDKQPIEGVIVFIDNKQIYALLMIEETRYYLPLKLVNGEVNIGDVLTVERGENTRVRRVHGINLGRT